MTRCSCIGRLTGKVPDPPGRVQWRWVVDVPDPECPAHRQPTE